ncbi:MAG: DNA topoisomerase 3 [Bacteroidia bacterium]|nr:DNA topoisomerase 3 [Bacteroidia bacterium]
MKLCIAEKPSVAAEIAKVLGCNQRNNGYYSGGDYCVTWVFGHLCELKEPHDYDPTLKRWDFSTLPILPQRFGIKVKDDQGVKRQFNIIKHLVESAEEVINCGDAGQEGELIQRWVLQLAEMKCPMTRLWISSLTEEAIREGFNSLRPSSDFDKLYAAGAARAMGDWLLGMNATRAYTLKYGGQGVVLSIGRVQTPTLALIVNRYLEIQNFKPESYWELKTVYRDVTFSATKGKFKSVEEAQQALVAIQDKPFTITDVQTKKGVEAPPRLFDLTSLQVECNKKFGFSADDTLRLIQSLYEKKLSTYPRVDTTYLSDDIYPKVPSILQGLAPYQNLVAPILNGGKIRKNKKVFDNSKVTDHHAIIPTGVPPHPNLTREEKLVYDQITRRFIANFYPDSEISTTTVMGESAEVGFKSTGKQILSQGWRDVYKGVSQVSANDDEKKQDGDATSNQVMPDFQTGESGQHSPAVQEKQTTPPKPYTEATLLRAMETAGKQVDDEELRDLMKDNGIGRPSTRAAIIETLFKRKFIVKEKKNLQPTQTGLRLIATIKNDLLKSVELTGQWEKKLREIERGEYDASVFLNEMRQMVSEVVQVVYYDRTAERIELAKILSGEKGKSAKTPATQKSKKETNAADESALVCPRCSRPIVKGKTAWGCMGYTEGCNVRVPFEMYGKKISATQLKALLTKGKTPVIKGLQVDGGKVDASLAFDSSFSIILQASESKAIDISEIKCPICGKAMVQGNAAWGCTGYTSGCRFVVPFTFMGKQLTVTHLSVLCKKGKTGVINGFVGQSGVKMSGRIVVDKGTGQLGLEE